MATATFVTQDGSTEGSWGGVYGSDGYSIAAGPQSLPSYATLSLVGDAVWTWSASTADTRALVDGSSRLAACWYSATSFTMKVNITDGNTHQIALYVVNWDSQPRTEIITITDASTGSVLSTQSLSAFSDGVWLVWNVSGSVVIEAINSGGSSNVVVSGVFFAPTQSAVVTPPTNPPSGVPGYTVVMVTTPTPPAHSAVLAWAPVSNASGYNVYRGTTSGSYSKLNASPLSTPSYVDLAVTAGTTYYYVTTSIINSVESGYSTQVPVSIPTP